MKYATTWLVLLLLTACQSNAPTSVKSADGDIRRQFESAIAGTLIKQTIAGYPGVDIAERGDFLLQQLSRFEQSVDRSQISRPLTREYRLLQYLAQAGRFNSDGADYPAADYAAKNYAAENYGARVRTLSSLDWSAHQFEQRVLDELSRIDQTITVLATSDAEPDFSLTRHMATVRQDTRYPQDSYAGRQDYLDALSEAMIDVQADWHDVLLRYEPSILAISGEVESNKTLRHEGDMLLINLDQVHDLPLFELRALAVFYGYPGLQSFAPADTDSLKQLLVLPGYTLGWAGYILDFIAARDVKDPLGLLYFSRLMGSLALADYRLHTGSWTLAQASEALYLGTPYSKNRIQMMLKEVLERPGHYLSGFSGKLELRKMNTGCAQAEPGCDARFHQAIVELGPLPFVMLTEELDRKI